MIKDVDFEIVGSLIKHLRENRELTQQELADALKVSKGAICQWEQGSGIKTEKLYDAARFFNITVLELINGQLNDDSDDESYFLRNYNLDEFENFDEINEFNYEDLIVYLKRCRNVIKRFMYLYPLHAEMNTTKKQRDEYYKLARYFKCDYEYLNMVELDRHVNSIDSAVKVLTDDYEITDSKELDYLLYKIFRLGIKVNAKALLDYEKDNRAVNDYLELIGKESVDTLLTNLVSYMTDSEIEKSLAVKRLITMGARCLYTRKDISSYENNEIDLDIFEHLDGVKENILIKEKRDFFKKEENTNNLFKRPDPYFWKHYQREEYELLVNHEKTDKIRMLVLAKEDNPKSYYQYLVNKDKNNTVNLNNYE